MDQDLNISQEEFKILIYTVSKFQPPIRYILGDMIPPRQGSSVFQDSSLKKTPGENCYILGYKGPNEISEDFTEMVQIVPFVVEFSDLKDEKVACASLYNFAMLNNPKTGHLGKTIISPNW